MYKSEHRLCETIGNSKSEQALVFGKGSKVMHMAIEIYMHVHGNSESLSKPISFQSQMCEEIYH